MANTGMDLTGKVAMVTGAGSGIGKAAALILAKAGAKIGALGLTQDQLQEVVDEIKEAGGEAILLKADVSKPDDMEAAVAKIGETWDRLDIVVANAGINGVWAPLEDITPDEWDTTLEVNLKGTFLSVKYALPYLKRQGGAVIVVASVNGTRMFSNTGATAYSCSKAAQIAFTKMTALELAPFKIRVNAICPGAITTQIDENTEKRNVDKVKLPVEFPKGSIPLTGGDPGSAEQCGQLILFLASDASSHIAGTEMWIDGAQSLLQG